MIQEQMSGDSVLRERAIGSPGAFFWPLFSIVGWGIGVVLHGWDTYVGSQPDEAQIQRKMDQLQQKG